MVKKEMRISIFYVDHHGKPMIQWHEPEKAFERLKYELENMKVGEFKTITIQVEEK